MVCIVFQLSALTCRLHVLGHT